MIAPSQSTKRIMVANPSQRELNDLYLPSHKEVGDEDWYTKIHLRSNQKQQKQVTSIIGGVETRGPLLGGSSASVSQKIKQTRQSTEKVPSIQ